MVTAAHLSRFSLPSEESPLGFDARWVRRSRIVVQRLSATISFKNTQDTLSPLLGGLHGPEGLANRAEAMIAARAPSKLSAIEQRGAEGVSV